MSLSSFFIFAGLGGMISFWAVGVIAEFGGMRFGFTL